MNPSLHIVLIEPEIPQNTGNIGRSCVGLGARLHLVGKLGFSLSEKEIRRSGLDYWPKLDVVHHADWAACAAQLPAGAERHFFSTHGRTDLWRARFRAPCVLVFGSESRGLAPWFHDTYGARMVRIPLRAEARSLNLSTAVGVAAFEAARQMGWPVGIPLLPEGEI